MGGQLSSLLDISRRSLQNQSKAIRVIGNNVANVNTEGYTRREVEFVDKVSADAGESSLGFGADVRAITRRVDEFLNKTVQTTIQDTSKASIRDELLARAEAPFSVDKTLRHIGFELSEFFSTLADLQANPGDLSLRAKLIEDGDGLTQAIRLTYQTLASVQRDADDRVRSGISEVNSITSKIAELNIQVSVSEYGAQENLGLRDQRDELLRRLSEKISYKQIEDSNGQVQIYLSNGFGLVTGGDSKQLEVKDAPSIGGFRVGLDQKNIGGIVWDADPGITSADVDLTRFIAAGSGEIAGLIKVRGLTGTAETSSFTAQGDIPEIASRVEALARDLLVRFNNAYRPMDGALVRSADLSGTNTHGAFSLFNITDNTQLSDLSGNLTEDNTDLNSSGRANFASRIRFAVSDPTRLALAKDEDNLNGSVAFSPGNGGIATDLLALRTANVSYSVGNFSTTTNIESLFNDTVTFIGGLSTRAKADLAVYKDRQAQAEELQNSTSGVSIDEELAKLIGFQRVYQASARMIKTGDQLLDELIATVTG